jgi:hypothetical protein
VEVEVEVEVEVMAVVMMVVVVVETMGVATVVASLAEIMQTERQPRPCADLMIVNNNV